MNSTNNSPIVSTSSNPYEQKTSIMMTHSDDLIRKRDEQINIYKEKEKQWIQERDMYEKKVKALVQQNQQN
jgi:hypothetical protein